MKRGYYLWDWYSTRTIKFQEDLEFHCDKFAREQDCYRRFNDAKKAGIAELERSIEITQRQLESLKKLTIEDVKK